MRHSITRGACRPRSPHGPRWPPGSREPGSPAPGTTRPSPNPSPAASPASPSPPGGTAIMSATRDGPTSRRIDLRLPPLKRRALVTVGGDARRPTVDQRPARGRDHLNVTGRCRSRLGCSTYEWWPSATTWGEVPIPPFRDASRGLSEGASGAPRSTRCSAAAMWPLTRALLGTPSGEARASRSTSISSIWTPAASATPDHRSAIGSRRTASTMGARHPGFQTGSSATNQSGNPTHACTYCTPICGSAMK